MQQSIIQYQASCKILILNNTVPLRSGTSKLSKNSKKKGHWITTGRFIWSFNWQLKARFFSWKVLSFAGLCDYLKGQAILKWQK